MELSEITIEVRTALQELLAEAALREKQILVIGCSTSEVSGKKIGTSSSMEVAAALWAGIAPLVQEHGIYPAIQCCEHLNRALVVEEEVLERYSLEQVAVYPVQGAGGSLANYAMKSMQHPVVVERIQAHAGIDIGDTLIGMHLKPVAVPVRGSLAKIGQAHLTMARTRPKLIGGERARYRCD